MLLRRLGLAIIAGLTVAASACGVAVAAEEPISFLSATPLSVDALARERGGFLTFNGFEFGFAAILQTAINGNVVLTTQLALQSNNSITTQTSVNTSLNNTPTPSGPVTVTPVSGSAQISAATGLNLSGVQGDGVVVKSPTGVTAVVNNVAANQLQNVVVNTASNQQITQNTALTLTLPGYAAVLSQMSGNQMITNLANALQYVKLH